MSAATEWLRMAGDGIDHGLEASFGPLATPEIRQQNPAALTQALQQAPPPRIRFGEVKSQAGMNEGLLQLRERLNQLARATPANRQIRYPNVGLAWYMPDDPNNPARGNLVRYMVARAGADPRQDQRLWQGNVGWIPPVPAAVASAPGTPAQVRDRIAHWRENQVRLLLQRVAGQRFRPQPLGHGGADLVRRFDDFDAYDDFDDLDAAIDQAFDDMAA